MIYIYALSSMIGLAPSQLLSQVFFVNFPSPLSSNIIRKDNNKSYFSSCSLVSSCTLLSRNASGSELGYVARQWRIGFHCRSYAFSLNYLTQTSWLAAMQNSEGLSLRKPKVGGPLSWG